MAVALHATSLLNLRKEIKMRHVQIILGPPGTGKTTSLLRIVEGALSRGVLPERIAYLAFTRKAANEAKERAMAQFGFDEQRFPYFRTLHSLAFKELGLSRNEVMGNPDYRKLGKALGVEFKGIYDENLGMHTGPGLGDKCSRIESLARVTLRGLEEQHNLSHTNDLTLHAVKQYDASLRKYKHENGLLDFTDMLERYDSALPVDVCIFDEAQDLSSLQYKMAIRAASEASEVYIAGDDDQAIFGWAGADVNKFLSLKGDVVVLPQSYRVPRSVHKVALGILDRIKHRYTKPWSPKIELGSVEHIADEGQINFDAGGTWMCLARSKYMLNRFRKVARQQGFSYSYNGEHSLETQETRAIMTWERVRSGKRASLYEAKNMKQFLPFTVTLKKQEDYGVEDFSLSTGSGDWMQVLRGIAPEEREYLRSCLRNDQKFNDKPRISISTIHQSKGGEADNVVLLTDVGKLSYENSHTDEENRVWYVAATRARENLFVVQPRSLRHYSL
jgi:DNA helicase II / ATP-dependent DNA helicase PcrA